MAFRFNLPIADVGRGISPASGAQLYFFEVGTSTPKTTYSDFALTTANTDPVVADANGRFGDIFLDAQADVELRTSAGVLIYGPKTVYDPTDSVTALAATAVSVTDAAGHYTATNVETVLDEIGDDFVKAARDETITGDRTYSTSVQKNPVFQNFSLVHNTVSSSSGTLTIDLSTGNSFDVTLTENITTLSITNVPATGHAAFVLLITQDGGGGAYAVTQPASVKVSGGTAPTITTSNDAIDELTYRTRDGGTTWLLSFEQAYA